MSASSIKIGTRGSALALAQANETRDRLIRAHPGLGAPGAVELVVIKTGGDRIQDRALSEAGGKGLFTREIEEALLSGAIDLAAHSMKDMPTQLPDGLEIGAYLPREDVRDAFLSRSGVALEDLPQGAVLGTASLRRQAQMLALRPDLSIVLLRGNVDTRLRKLAEGEIDAMLLAMAGLRRLGLEDRATVPMPVERLLPAVAQGAIGLERRSGDVRIAELLAPLHCADTGDCVEAERRFLAALDGSCRTPIAGLAQLEDGGATVHLRGLVLSPDGRLQVAREARAPRAEARAMAAALGAEIAALLPPDLFAH